MSHVFEDAVRVLTDPGNSWFNGPGTSDPGRTAVCLWIAVNQQLHALHGLSDTDNLKYQGHNPAYMAHREQAIEILTEVTGCEHGAGHRDSRAIQNWNDSQQDLPAVLDALHRAAEIEAERPFV